MNQCLPRAAARTAICLTRVAASAVGVREIPKSKSLIDMREIVWAAEVDVRKEATIVSEHFSRLRRLNMAAPACFKIHFPRLRRLNIG